jgi:N-acetylmuramoyl-L-alanine amidase
MATGQQVAAGARLVNLPPQHKGDMMRVVLARYWLALPLLVLVLVLSFAASWTKEPIDPAPIPRTVCLDPGHGGTDRGATYAGLPEKHLTLDIAQRLRSLLVDSGFAVVMTRTDDVTLSNTERATICNDGGADTVLSIHLNASTDSSVDYFKAFYGKRHKDQDFTQTIWSSYNLSSPTDSNAAVPKSPVARFASGVLLKTIAPATLAETVFLSHPDEQALLGDGTSIRQQEIAQELYDGLMAWYQWR